MSKRINHPSVEREWIEEEVATNGDITRVLYVQTSVVLDENDPAFDREARRSFESDVTEWAVAHPEQFDHVMVVGPGGNPHGEEHLPRWSSP